MTNWVREHRLGDVVRSYWAQHKVVHERRQLLDRPWLEDVMHWTADGQLHGHVTPPAEGRGRSVTSDGWCPGQRPQR